MPFGLISAFDSCVFTCLCALSQLVVLLSDTCALQMNIVKVTLADESQRSFRVNELSKKNVGDLLRELRAHDKFPYTSEDDAVLFEYMPPNKKLSTHLLFLSTALLLTQMRQSASSGCRSSASVNRCATSRSAGAMAV